MLQEVATASVEQIAGLFDRQLVEHDGVQQREHVAHLEEIHQPGRFAVNQGDGHVEVRIVDAFDHGVNAGGGLGPRVGDGLGVDRAKGVSHRASRQDPYARIGL